MNEGGYKIRNQAAIHFITFAVVEWVDVFTRKQYRILFWKVLSTARKTGLCYCIAGVL
ncbi:MAG: hypothetical protein WDO16_26115 [Bacteroidota bacterium]